MLKRDEYWLDRLQQCSRSSNHIWRSPSSVLAEIVTFPEQPDIPPTSLPRFFSEDRRSPEGYTTGLSAPTVQLTTTSSFTAFEECTPADMRRLIMKSCSLDPVPTFLVREFVDVLLPYVMVWSMCV